MSAPPISGIQKSTAKSTARTDVQRIQHLR
jgi:hypothetical protein